MSPPAVLIALSFLFAIGYFFLRAAAIDVPTFFRPSPAERLLISMEGFRLVRSEGGAAVWRMSASAADLYESKEAQLSDVEILYGGAARRVTLLGDTARLKLDSGDAVIRRGTRDVKIITSDGYLVTTASLAWNAGERTIRTPEPFKVLGRELYLEGTGLKADVDLHTLTVNGNVKAVLQE